MVNYCPLDDTLSQEEIQKPLVVSKSEKKVEDEKVDEVVFYDMDGVMDSELGYMVVVFIIGVSVLVAKDVMKTISW